MISTGLPDFMPSANLHIFCAPFGSHFMPSFAISFTLHVSISGLPFFSSFLMWWVFFFFLLSFSSLLYTPTFLLPPHQSNSCLLLAIFILQPHSPLIPRKQLTDTHPPPFKSQCPPSINSSSLAISNFSITLHSSQSLHYLLLLSLLLLSRVSA